MIKIILIFIALCIQYPDVLGQSKVACSNSSDAQTRLIRKQSLSTISEKLPKGSLLLCLNYDFEDSISICISNNNILTAHLKFTKLDSSNSHFPYNQAVIDIGMLSTPSLITSNQVCTIRFINTKKRVEFKIKKKFSCYSLEISNSSNVGYLYCLNALPWPD